MRTPRVALGYVALGLLLGVPPVAAQSTSNSPSFYEEDLVDQDGAVYGRIRHVEGTLSLRRDNQITDDLVMNDPVAPGDIITTGPDGRCEVQLADGSLIRLDHDTELVLQSLSDSTNQIENTTILQIGYGAALVRASEMDTNEKRFQIDTDSTSIFLLSNGDFRLEVRDTGATVVSSRRGVAEVMAQDISTMVRSGERTVVRPGQIPAEPQVFNTRLADDFDLWASDLDDDMLRRARVDDQQPAGLPEPVHPYVGELSYYGHWYHNPSYGWVWRPVGVAGDWQPYLDGRWVYSPAGIVWVSYEPWGWAPYHYGRWEFLVGTGWIWIPGNVFSGAYVAWSVSPGYVGWCPLGYYDTPVSFRFSVGTHHDPWVYVRGHNLYAPHVTRVVVRDVTVVRDIERERVVVRGAPRIDPRRLANAPRVTDEFHRTFKDRNDLQLKDAPGSRRMPFHESERQRLVRINNRRIRGSGERDLHPVGSTQGRERTPVSMVPSGRQVTVPRRTPQNGRPPATPNRPTARPRQGAQPPQGRGTQQPGADRSGRDRQGTRQQAPRATDGKRENSTPERVIPRIIPRSNPSTDRRKQKAEPRGGQQPSKPKEHQAGPAGGRGGQPDRPSQAKPRQAPRKPTQPPRKNQGGGKGKGGGKKKDKD